VTSQHTGAPWLGMAGIVGGVLLAGRYLWDYLGRGRTQLHVGYPASSPEDYLFFFVPLLLSCSLVGVYRLSAGAAGPWGRRGLVAALIGCGLWSLGEWGEAWVPEGFTWGLVMLLGWLVLALGLGFFSIVRGTSERRAGRRPSWRWLTLVALSLLPIANLGVVLIRGSTPVDAGPNLVLMVLFGGDWVLLGYALCCTGSGTRPTPPAKV